MIDTRGDATSRASCAYRLQRALERVSITVDDAESRERICVVFLTRHRTRVGRARPRETTFLHRRA